jgi:hypothetical protein
MNSELKSSIEQFIVDYENQINDMDKLTTDIFLEKAINLLEKVIKQEERLS